ncbi:ABC transporter permease [Microvirga makkahensis]|uniref:ABC transporter permease subunit n=1 Tax=Microvirga makkahensis TaxID=1128670 RepID=A0A7X3MQQ2_9HYPH|nr:proline/glycine betaine ABC transporter permease [Microvirga makkahensis]MXQ11483.1 ABC transporter permease subunit [Microvirga makkahensis]
MDFDISIGAGASAVVEYMLDNFSPTLDAIADGIGLFADGIKDALLGLPSWALIALVSLFALWRIGWKFALVAGVALLLIVGMGLWKETVETLALVIAATAIAIVIGIPLGIAMARSAVLAAVTRPLLDLMQTMPAFVYLIPAAMFFGLGAVPGTIATVIFSMPPVVRLTALGLTQVNREFVEAGLAFGCTDRQLLFKVQFPLALPSIMAGVNQTIMLGLSMVVIASMIGAGGLGNTVLTGIQRLDVGLGFEGGLAVVILAIILDRLTQSLSRPAAFPLPYWALRRSRSAPEIASLKTAPAKTGA